MSSEKKVQEILDNIRRDQLSLKDNLRRYIEYKDKYEDLFTPIGYVSCWKFDERLGRCRKPENHEGDCAFCWCDSDGKKP